MEKLTYNKKKFECLVSNILHKSGYEEKVQLWLLENQSEKKSHKKKYITFDNIEEDTIYGVSLNFWNIEFDIKVGKIESLLKTFITQFSSKYKSIVIVDGEFKNETKEEIRKNIIEKNQNRVSDGLFYTTLYGIGFWAIFCRKADYKDLSGLSEYLKSKGVPFRNEWSEACWSFRFVINGSVEFHNELLTNFKSN